MTEPWLPPGSTRSHDSTAPPGTSTDQFGRTLSAWPKRLVAHFVDLTIFLVPFLAASVVTGKMINSSEVNEAVGTESLWALAVFARLSLVGALGASLLVYSVVLHGGERGQTLGKRLMGVQVRDALTGDRLGYRKALLRTFVQMLLGGFPGRLGMILDGIWPLWDPQRRTLHDKAAGSVVVDVPRSPRG